MTVKEDRVTELERLIETMQLAMQHAGDDEEYRVKNKRLQEWIRELSNLKRSKPSSGSVNPKEVKLYPTRPVKVGEEVVYDVGSPGTGRTIYRVTRVERDGTPYGILEKDTVRELDPRETE